MLLRLMLPCLPLYYYAYFAFACWRCFRLRAYYAILRQRLRRAAADIDVVTRHDVRCCFRLLLLRLPMLDADTLRHTLIAVYVTAIFMMMPYIRCYVDAAAAIHMFATLRHDGHVAAAIIMMPCC